MGAPLSLYQKKFIERHVEQGQSSPWIAEQLSVSVWVVRKWRQLLKKAILLKAGWDVPQKVV